MADPLPALAPASPGRRRLLLGWRSRRRRAAHRSWRALAAPGAAPMVLGFDLAAEVSVTASCICIFDAAGRLRVVFGAFPIPLS